MKLLDVIAFLKEKGVESPEAEARELFYTFGGYSRSALLTRELEVDDSVFTPILERRASGEPLQYIVGEVAFYNEIYKVNPNVLIPRSDTEILVDFAVKNLKDGSVFLDLCTGSGCVGISTLKNTRDTTCIAVDISERALSLAEENARLNGVSERFRTAIGDARDKSFASSLFNGKLDAVLSNPPYIDKSEYEGLSREVKREPTLALLADCSGLEFYIKMTPVYKRLIKPGGFIAYEIGYDQAKALKKIAAECEMDVAIIKDYSDNDRVAVLKNPS